MISLPGSLAARIFLAVAAVSVPAAAVVTVVHLSGSDQTGVADAPVHRPPTSAVPPATGAPDSGPGSSTSADGPTAVPVAPGWTPSVRWHGPVDPGGESGPARTPADPTPAEPTPVDPTPADPTPADPTPADPTPPAFVPAAAHVLADAQVDQLAAKGLFPGGAAAASAFGAQNVPVGVTRADVATALGGALQRQGVSAPSGGTFSAIDVRSWADTQVDTAAHLGVLTETAGRFTAVPGIDRAETAELFSAVLDGRLTTAPLAPAPTPFSDSGAVALAQATVGRLADAGILNGRDEGTFDPNSKVTRQDFAVMLVHGLGLTELDPSGAFSDVAVVTYTDSFLAAAEHAGLIRSTDTRTFRPADGGSWPVWETLAIRQLQLTNEFLTGPGGGVPPIYLEPIDVLPTPTAPIAP